MRFSRFFIDRPIFAAVIAVVITVVGALAFIGLPVSQYPDIVPPTVTVTAQYPGASAETVASTVAAPIEQEINGVDDMLYQSSQSTGDGKVTITVTFKIGTDLDALESGLTRVRKMVGPDVDIFCSVWLPSKQLLARMKFRPWAGVFLSEEYLGSVKRAEDITVSQLEIFARHGATALIESPVTKDADWAQCERRAACGRMAYCPCSWRCP